MLEAAKALLLKSLTQDLRLRESEAVYLSDRDDRLHHQGQPVIAQAVWEMWRHNEVELIKLRAEVEALVCR
jgi:hypothetical protein